MSNLERYENVFIKVFSFDKVSGNPKRGETPSWDSIGHMQLISEIEDVFNIMLDTEDIIGIDTYENGKEILKKYDIKI